MEKIDEFLLKDGRVVQIVLPSMKGLKAVTQFVNKLSKEDTFLSFAGEEYTIAFEKNWLRNMLIEIEKEKNYHLWALYDGQIIGSVNIRRGGNRDQHVGDIGLMIDKDFRRQGLGKYFLNKIIEQGKLMDFKIATLAVFSDNTTAISLYKKMGFREYGKLPNGLFRKNKYSDKIEMYKEL
jgi:RimJ/RimL family protein N-acetyltransferase